MSGELESKVSLQDWLPHEQGPWHLDFEAWPQAQAQRWRAVLAVGANGRKMLLGEREQDAMLLQTVEVQPKSIVSEARSTDTREGWKQHLLKNLIPRMIYTRGDAEGQAEHEKSVSEFRAFMEEFGFPEDTEAIVNLIENSTAFDPVALRKLELLVAKVEALQTENYERIDSIKKELDAM